MDFILEEFICSSYYISKSILCISHAYNIFLGIIAKIFTLSLLDTDVFILKAKQGNLCKKLEILPLSLTLTTVRLH